MIHDVVNYGEAPLIVTHMSHHLVWRTHQPSGNHGNKPFVRLVTLSIVPICFTTAGGHTTRVIMKENVHTGHCGVPMSIHTILGMDIMSIMEIMHRDH